MSSRTTQQQKEVFFDIGLFVYLFNNQLDEIDTFP